MTGQRGSFLFLNGQSTIHLSFNVKKMLFTHRWPWLERSQSFFSHFACHQLPHSTPVKPILPLQGFRVHMLQTISSQENAGGLDFNTRHRRLYSDFLGKKDILFEEIGLWKLKLNREVKVLCSLDQDSHILYFLWIKAASEWWPFYF